MNKTPVANRRHVGIFGSTNSGKSALFNAITNTNISIVSDISGTTTDPVKKTMELIPFGPIVLIDTAGLQDASILGEKRKEKTIEILGTIDFAVYVVDGTKEIASDFQEMKVVFEEMKIEYIVVYTKADLTGNKTMKNGIFVSIYDKASIDKLKLTIANKLSALDDIEPDLMEGLLPNEAVVVMVIPIDSEAPKGRLILPQVQLIRSCLDNGIRCNITTELELEKALEQSKRVDLVVTDSQIFKLVDKIVPKEIPLTSFSILMARQKGNIDKLIEGAEKIKSLKDGDKILIAEVCTHNKTHEDIGNVKIPTLLKTTTGKDLIFDFVVGKDYPEELEKYALIVHCGGCMITATHMKNRMKTGVEITNYGMAIASCNGILDRSIEIIKNARN